MFYENNKVLVTGGGGFVESHYFARAPEKGSQSEVPVHRRRFLIEDESFEAVST
jgi:hypothetical protein